MGFRYFCFSETMNGGRITRCARDPKLGVDSDKSRHCCAMSLIFCSRQNTQASLAFCLKQKIPTAKSNRDSSVGVAGFEPATSWSQTRRDDRATLHPEKKQRRDRDSNPGDVCTPTD